MRGKADSRPVSRLRAGIIPAYAVISKCLRQNTRISVNRPRVCGEKFVADLKPMDQAGSPPRMRGKGDDTIQTDSDRGITPAYAGKSTISDFLTTGTRDHPRVCGEKVLLPFSNPERKGSPPRMRGKAFFSGTGIFSPGITPAYAGKSPGAAFRVIIPKDHPRVCGEKLSSWNFVLDIMGSPPRMRGKASGCQRAKLDTGITPAYAGKSP